jgi:putative sugar O-methyltransferase
MPWECDKAIAAAYEKAVRDSNLNDETFKNFRQNQHIGSVVGAMTNLEGKHETHTIQWAEWLLRKHPEVFQDIQNIKTFDNVGNPFLKALRTPDGIVYLSSSTLRYLYTAYKIKEEFNLDYPIEVTELGVGYGGLSAAMNYVFDIKNYYLMDLPEVQALAQRYLKEGGFYNTSIHIPKQHQVDLFVSEYCLSEFDDKGIESFYDKYIKNCNLFYIASNLVERRPGHVETRRECFLSLLKKNHKVKIKKCVPIDTRVEIIYGIKNGL